MIAFVDESGDTGMKLGRGSSPHFVVTIVIFSDEAHAQQCNNAINTLRTTLGFGPKQEFKFSKCSRAIRLAFFELITKSQFCYYSFALNKANVHSPGFQHKDSHYKLPINYLFQNARKKLIDARVFFDACGGRQFTEELRRYLNKKIVDKNGRCLIKKMTAQKSHQNSLIQLADMVCGAVARSLDPKKDSHSDFRHLIKQHEVRVQIWP